MNPTPPPPCRLAAACAAAAALAATPAAAGLAAPAAEAWPWVLAAGLAAGLAGAALGCILRRRAAGQETDPLRQALAESFDGLISICSPDHYVEYMNEAFIRHLGRDATGEPCHEVLQDFPDICPGRPAPGGQAGETLRQEVRSPRDGRWYSVVSAPLRRADGRTSTLALIRDITAHKEMEQALVESEKRYHTLADHNYGWELWLAPDRTVLYSSSSCNRITGWDAEHFAADPGALEALVHREDLEAWKNSVQLAGRSEWSTLEFRVVRRDGLVRWMSQACRRAQGRDGEDLGLRASIRDITPGKAMEQELRHMALHDPLTGLANRTLCLDRVGQAMNRSRRREDYYYAVVFMDLDRFKNVNDSFGHALGDKLLEEVGRRLVLCVRSLDLVARFGGDEFVLLLEELESPRQAVRIIKRAALDLVEPFFLEGHEMALSASFGVVLGPAEYDQPEDLLRNANIALHRAKDSGRNKILVFNSRMLEEARELMTLENDLRRAVARGEFFVEFQPILGLSDGRVQGFEALVRWRHPERGVVSPAEFIPAAEDTGLIMDIGRFVLEEACRTMARWRKAGLGGGKDLILAVNLSARQFSQPDLVETVRSTLANTGLPPEVLKLEITETTIMENPDLAAEKFERFKAMGVQMSVDDFGTGYSSMSYLQRFPLDHLKIDLSFVRTMDQAPENREIVKAIINLAHSLGLKVVAEGVERAGQRDLLADLHCEYGQGYHFSRPISAADAEALLRSLA